MIIQNSSPNSSNKIQQSNPPSTSSISIESVEKSIEKLITNWNRRQKWNRFFLHTTPQQEPDKSLWRTNLAKFLESTPVRLIAISLLLVDLILTVLELSTSLLSCKSTTPDKGVEERWYHWIGIAILSLLCFKSFCLVIALGGSFFRRAGNVVDGVILVVAMLLEAFLERMGGGLVVVVSLWKVVRVVESAFELSDEAIEAQIEGVVSEFQTLKDENERLLGIIHEKDEVIHKLQEELDQLYKAYMSMKY